MTAPIHRYVVRSDIATSGLSCPADVARDVADLCAPYFEIGLGEPEPDSWRIEVETVPPAAAERIVVTALGEDPLEYAVDTTTRAVYHVAPLGRDWVVQSLVRATRAIHRSVATRTGAVMLHAGLMKVRERGVAVVGASRAGKTSLIMASVLEGLARPVCNDDVGLVLDPAGGVRGHGWPRSVSVRLDTLQVLLGSARADEVVTSLRHPANRTLSRLRAEGIEPHGTALLYGDEYCRLLGAVVAKGASVDAVVHLSMTNEDERPRMQSLDRDTNVRLLTPQFMNEPNKHLNIFDHACRDGSADEVRDALAGLPAFRFRYRFQDLRGATHQLADHLDAALSPTPQGGPQSL